MRRVAASRTGVERDTLIAGCGLAGLSALAFAPALWAGRAADDFILERTLRGLGSPERAFTVNDLGQAGEAGHFYRPIWLVWNEFLQWLGGSDSTVFHGGNVVLYCLITVEVWLLARLLMPAVPAVLAGAVFAVYPRHTESVSWISGSTDLVASALALGALLALAGRFRLPARLALSVALAALAALAKESTVVLPMLALLVCVLAGERLRLPAGFGRWLLVPVCLALAQIPALVLRYDVLGGLGGYGADWSPQRAAVAFASHVAAAFTPSQIQLLRTPVLALVPLALFALLAGRVVAEAARRPEARRPALFGCLWFLVASVPALRLAVDLNTANGERLMFLASVGWAIALGYTLAARTRPGRAIAALAIGACLVLSGLAASSWVTATRLAERVVGEVTALGPRDGTVILAVSPSGYRNAHVLLGISLEAAVEVDGRPDLEAALCVPAHVRTLDPGQISIQEVAPGAFELTAGKGAGFDFPFLRRPEALAECAYSLPDDRTSRRGLESRALVTITPPDRPTLVLGYDGAGLVPLK